MLFYTANSITFLSGVQDIRATWISHNTRTCMSDRGRRVFVAYFSRTHYTRSRRFVEYTDAQVPDRMHTFSAFAPVVLSVPDRGTG